MIFMIGNCVSFIGAAIILWLMAWVVVRIVDSKEWANFICRGYQQKPSWPRGTLKKYYYDEISELFIGVFEDVNGDIQIWVSPDCILWTYCQSVASLLGEDLREKTRKG